MGRGETVLILGKLRQRLVAVNTRISEREQIIDAGTQYAYNAGALFELYNDRDFLVDIIQQIEGIKAARGGLMWVD